MKKLLSLGLALCLALTLAVPALAIDVNSADYMAGFSAGYDLGYDKGYDEGWSNGYDEGYDDGSGNVTTEYNKGYNDGWNASYEKGYLAGQKDAEKGVYDLPDYSEGRENPDECTYQEGYDDGAVDGYADGYENGAYDQSGLWSWQVGELQESGGIFGQVNVMLDGTCIQFPDTQPKIVDGRTMLPIRAVTESLGMEVAWDPATRTVTISQEDVSVAFAIGSETATITQGEEKTQLTMDCAAYIDGNRTMVPLRFLSEGLGYDVLWDADYRTVVLVDKEALIADIDADFSKFNEMSAKQKALSDLGENQKVSMALTGALTLYDETGKATKNSFGADVVLSTDGQCLRAELTLNLKDIVSGLVQNADDFEDTLVSLKDMLSVDWSQISATLLMDKDGTCWLNAPALNILAWNAGKDTWVNLGSLNEVTESVESGNFVTTSPVDLEGLLELGQNATVGEALVAMLAEDEDAFHVGDNIDSVRNLLAAMYSDSVAKSGTSSCTWTLDADKLLEAMGYSGEYLEEAGWTVELTGKTTMDTDGNTGIKGNLSASSDFYSTVTGSLDVSGSVNKANGSLTLSMADAFDFSCAVTCSAEKLSVLPEFAPPAGATCLTVEELTEEDTAE